MLVRRGPSLNDERRAHVESIFDAALSQPSANRDAWVSGACSGDVELKREVDTLLAAHVRAGGILDVPAIRIAAASTDETGDVAFIAERLGPYQLVREVGRGGMGRVFLAVRDDAQFEQRVAIKILDRGFSPELVARFIAERQILASLEHPHIARLFDGGMTADRRPYLVMEYVDGEPIDVYCQRHALSVDDRLRLFCKVAEAVHYAHRSLVIHRDLKPSNILVTTAGEPKLLDFGIAKLLDPDAPYASPTTETGHRMMTLEYASPEQITAQPATTALDVYALGLVLYELLTGVRAQSRGGLTFGELEQIILTEDPLPPSVAALSGDSRHARATNSGDRTTGRDAAAWGRVHRKLRGDLDRIVLMAIRKEPARRYKSAQGLAVDVDRYLSGTPVAARGNSSSYRARKFVKRHRWAVGMASAMVLLLVGYAATITVQARRVERALTDARFEAERAEQVSAFTMGLFGADYQARTEKESQTVRAFLADAAARADRFAGARSAQAEMLDVVGRAYQRLGDYAAAQPYLERALALRREVLGARNVATAESMFNLAGLLGDRGDYAAAEALFRESMATQRALVGGDHARVARTMDGLGLLLQERGDYPAAERLTRDALAIRRRVLGSTHPEVAQSLLHLAYQLQLQGRQSESEPLYREALDLRMARYGPDHPDVAAVLSNLGLLEMQRNNLRAADSLYRSAMDIRRRTLGNDHPDVSLSLGLLGALRRREGNLVAAESLYRESIEVGVRSLGETHPDLAHTINGLALVMQAKGDLATADSLYRHVLEIRRRVLGPEHPAIATSLHQLGVLHGERGEFEAAERLLREALAMRRKLLGDGHPSVAATAAEVAKVQAKRR